jgi:hypothetical protein
LPVSQCEIVGLTCESVEPGRGRRVRDQSHSYAIAMSASTVQRRTGVDRGRLQSTSTRCLGRAPRYALACGEERLPIPVRELGDPAPTRRTACRCTLRPLMSY